jgi:hypothetical protein
MTPKGNSRANGISEGESNNEANCEAECNIARHNLAGACSAGGDGGRRSPEASALETRAGCRGQTPTTANWAIGILQYELN